MEKNLEVVIADRKIGLAHPTYFIADIAANHDGDFQRAIDLIHLAAEAGADAAKFQNFKAEHIVSDYGFKNLGSQQSHQASWKKSVYEVYEEASLAWEWTQKLKSACDSAGIHYFSSPYDIAAVDMLDNFVPAYKIGSGDISFQTIIEHMAQKNKPMLLATGASDLEDVKRAMQWIQKYNKQIILMQCNTNYTASVENYKHINLNVLKSYAELFPEAILGLSDHTKTLTTVLGAIALGARAIEKHFTDDNNREGPDHLFSLNPSEWKEMIERSRELELALGDGIKRVEANEKETVILQRRCLRASHDLEKGATLQESDLEALRPASPGAQLPYELEQVLGKKLKNTLQKGQELNAENLDLMD